MDYWGRPWTAGWQKPRYTQQSWGYGGYEDRREVWNPQQGWRESSSSGQYGWEELRSRAVPPPPRPRQRLQVPELDLCGQDRGHLLEVLALVGAVHLSPGWEHVGSTDAEESPVRPEYDKWRALMLEATSQKKKWKSRPCVHDRHLRFSACEDLSRTLLGEAKYHEPDNRVAFGLSESSAKSQFVDWGDLKWAPEGYMALKAAVAKLFESEVASLCSTENGNRDLLGVKLRLGWEKWGRSGLRHCVYPAEGTCSSHTDYGVVTLQLSNGPGLEVFAHGSWQVLEEPPEGGALLFAGDMLERLTNGQIKALPHRVHVQKESLEVSDGGRGARQSHIIFLQPDSDTWVAPLKPYLLNNGNDLAPIRYGDWHQMKVRLAFDGW
ncbi:2ODD19 [Symbiodinium sp. CCMP2456]|nr:2ODD19 [Symbiodinium sp. CCMP2456]